MATSASKETTSGHNNHYHTYMSITVNSQDKTNGRSNVTVKMYAKSDSTTYKYAGSSTVKLTVDGVQKVSKTISVNFANKATVTLATWTGDIDHDDNGDKTLACSGSWTADSDWVDGGSISLSIKLDNIPPATVPTLSASSVVLGKVLTIGLSPAVSGWTHNLYYRFGTGSWTRFATGQTGDYAWTVPLSLANSITAATSATLTIGVNTYNGSTLIGTTQSVNVKVTLPSSIKPTITDVTISEGNDDLAEFGAYVQGKTKLHIVTTAEGAYGSTIKSYKHTIAGTAYTASADYTSGAISKSGDIAVVTTVTDSRGRTASSTTTVTVYAYNVPQITRFACVRCGEDGTVNNNGTCVKVSMAFCVSPVNQANAGAYKIEYKASTASDYTEITSGETYDYDGETVTEGIFAISAAYNIRLTVADSFTSADAVADIGTAVRLLSYIIKKMAIAIGKFAELENTFDIALPTVFRDQVDMDYTDTEKKISIRNMAHRDGLTYADNGVYPHYCKIYGGDAGSIVAIGCYDIINNLPIWRYSDTDQSLRLERKMLIKNHMHPDDNAYNLGGNANTFKGIYGRVMRIGIDDYKTAGAVYTRWADGEHHNIVTRSADGLTAIFGWSGSSDYKTVTKLFGQTVQYSDSSGSTVLSDERLKNGFKTLEDYEGFFKNLKPVAFKYNNGASGRYHIGFKAQDVKSALESAGLTTQDFGGFVQTAVSEADDDYQGIADPQGLIYTEFTALNTYMILRLMEQVEVLINGAG